MIDPNVAPVRALPRDERELFIAASNVHVLAFDNVSGLPPWLSDTLCRLTSGGAFSIRRLFTDQDEILLTGRPTGHSQRDRVPSPIDQNPCAHWRNPMDMMRQG